MKEPCTEGVASHRDPESCASRPQGVREALTGGNAGQPWSSEINPFGAPTLFGEREGNTVRAVSARRSPALRSPRP